MEILAQYGHVLVIVAALFGFFMAYGVGANDVLIQLVGINATTGLVLTAGDITSIA